MKKVFTLALVAVSSVLIGGCAQVSAVLFPLAQVLVQPLPNISLSSEILQQETNLSDEKVMLLSEEELALLKEGAVVQLTASCEAPDFIPGGDDDCIGTYIYEDWVPERISNITAYHEGDGEFVVTLYREDGSSEVVVSATGVYTSETFSIPPAGIVRMIVQSTGDWRIEFKPLE